MDNSLIHILAVDDNPVNLKLISALLESRGYQVYLATGGDEAIKLIEEKKPDLVLLDVMMPGISGYEVCQRLRAQESTSLLPIILVTSLDDSERIQGIEAGADDFLTKPINQNDLFARVKSLLRIKFLQEEILEKSRELEDINIKLEEKVSKQVKELEKLGTLKRFLPDQVANQILLKDKDIVFNPHRKEISVVFIDLRGFTTFVDSAEPEEVMKVLTEYHSEMGRLITKHNGTLEHFAGDGIMIFFNDPIPMENHSQNAIELAIEMQREFPKLRDNWKKMGFELGLGVGVTRGFATLGMIGFEGRYDYAAIGSVCNIAARLSDEAQDGDILFDLKTFSNINHIDPIEKLGGKVIRGFARSMEIFRIQRY